MLILLFLESSFLTITLSDKFNIITFYHLFDLLGFVKVLLWYFDTNLNQSAHHYQIQFLNLDCFATLLYFQFAIKSFKIQIADFYYWQIQRALVFSDFDYDQIFELFLIFVFYWIQGTNCNILWFSHLKFLFY